VRDVFGSESDAWFERLDLNHPLIAQADVPFPGTRHSTAEEELLFLRETDPQTKSIKPSDLFAPPIDPSSPHSAVEGITL